MGTIQTALTFEEFERLPEYAGKQELLRGELIELPPADLQHNQIAERIYNRLNAALAEAHAQGRAPEVGRVHHEMGYSLATDVWVQPDVSLTYADQRRGKYYEGSPAVAIEVISPSNTVEEMDLKTDLYFDFGAREVWRVYPKTRKVVVHLSKTEALMRYDTVATTLLPGLAISIAEMLEP